MTKKLVCNSGRENPAPAWIYKCVSAMLVIALLTVPAACAKKPAADGKIRIVYTVCAFGEIAKAIGGGDITAISLMPPGVELHDFEPTTKDIASVRDADFFLHSDLLDAAWLDVVENTCRESGTKIVNISEGILPIELPDGGVDPHFWLSLKNAAIMAEAAKSLLSETDPQNAAVYTQNYNEFVEDITRLVDNFSGKFASLQKRVLVTNHAAFAYLCAEFGLEENSVAGVFAEGEPSAKELAKLTDFCRANEIRTIFAEQDTDDSVMLALAGEIGGYVGTLCTLESGDAEKDSLELYLGANGISGHSGYINAMNANLQTIYEGLMR